MHFLFFKKKIKRGLSFFFNPTNKENPPLTLMNRILDLKTNMKVAYHWTNPSHPMHFLNKKCSYIIQVL